MFRGLWYFAGDLEEPPLKIKLQRAILFLSMYVVIPAMCLLILITVQIDNLIERYKNEHR